MSDRLRILFVAANPQDTDRLELEKEHRLLRNLTRDNAEAGNCEFFVEWAARPVDLLTALAATSPHVVHFAGHGTGRGICFEDDEGRSRPLGGEALQLVFRQALKHLRVVVLNACLTAPQVEELRRLVDFVVATEAPVTDAAALRFSQQFYRALAVGETVREAYLKAQGGAQGAAGPYAFLARDGADETTPLLPPSRGNRADLNVRELKAGRAVIANDIQLGPVEPRAPDAAAPDEKNQIVWRSERADVGELYVANRYRRAGGRDDEGREG